MIRGLLATFDRVLRLRYISPMPTYDTRTGEPAKQVVIEIPKGLEIRSIAVRHDEVSFVDALGREAVLVSRPTHPGAGLAVDLAEHVETDA